MIVQSTILKPGPSAIIGNETWGVKWLRLSLTRFISLPKNVHDNALNGLQSPLLFHYIYTPPSHRRVMLTWYESISDVHSQSPYKSSLIHYSLLIPTELLLVHYHKSYLHLRYINLGMWMPISGIGNDKPKEVFPLRLRQ